MALKKQRKIESTFLLQEEKMFPESESDDWLIKE